MGYKIPSVLCTRARRAVPAELTNHVLPPTRNPPSQCSLSRCYLDRDMRPEEVVREAFAAESK